MKLGEQSLPEVPQRGGHRGVLVALSDILDHPAPPSARTGLPQSAVSNAVARLKESGFITTAPDPRDGRRTLISRAAEVSERVTQVRATTIHDALARALGTDDAAAVEEVAAALSLLSERLRVRPEDPAS
ncbi:MarR family transcriptional regulator [Nocardia sp. NBC_01388]|uniref:MarR family transcriptional regulator n=1 Tax=Nocardia sp. NBC_01388 TaxID=2903596 RepID=UPI0032520DBD